MTRKIATDLRPGDIVHYNGQVDWELGEVVRETEKTITFRITIIRAEWAESSVGRVSTWRFRRGTEVEVTEPVRSSIGWCATCGELEDSDWWTEECSVLPLAG